MDNLRYFSAAEHRIYLDFLHRGVDDQRVPSPRAHWHVHHPQCQLFQFRTAHLPPNTHLRQVWLEIVLIPRAWHPSSHHRFHFQAVRLDEGGQLPRSCLNLVALELVGPCHIVIDEGVVI